MASDDSDSDDDGSDHRIYKFKGSISDFRRVVCKFCRHEDKNARLDCLVELGNCCKQANEIRTHDWMNSEEYKSVSSEGNDVCKFCNTSHKDTLIAAKLPEDWPSYQLSNCCEQNYFAFEQYSSKESTIRLLQQYLVMPEDNEEEAQDGTDKSDGSDGKEWLDHYDKYDLKQRWCRWCGRGCRGSGVDACECSSSECSSSECSSDECSSSECSSGECSRMDAAESTQQQ
jgi:hypothetical protein